MKRMYVRLSEAERRKLLEERRRRVDCRSERALAVLHSAAGRPVGEISAILMRSPQTVCRWLHEYEDKGLDGLDVGRPAGRPDLLMKDLLPRLSAYFAGSPRDHGWDMDAWNTGMLMAQLDEDGAPVSRSTLARALGIAGLTVVRTRGRKWRSKLARAAAKAAAETPSDEP